MSINMNLVPEILRRSPTAESFATYAARRERKARDGVSRLPAIRAQMAKDGFDPVPQDLLLMFRELERAGIGALKGEYFKWNVSMKKVGLALEGPDKIFTEGGAVKREYMAIPKPKATHPLPTRASVKSMVVVLGIGREVSIDFTANLTRADIDFVMTKLLQHYKE